MRRLRVLGPLEVDGAAAELGPRDRVVVSALALRPGERVDAEVLAEALWGEEPPASAAKVVQGCVSRLRKALGVDAIETVDGGYRVRSDELDIDRQQFEDQVERARGYLATRTPQRAIPLLTEALGLWRGPAFGELEDWMPGRLEAVRLGQLRLAAEEDLLQARLDAGDHAGVATDGTVLTGQQPFRERRWALLALAQYRSGRQADALSSIRAARRALGQELGLDPGSELVGLESRILAQDPGLATDHEARMADVSCPWKGLASYGERDGDTFFGRDADIAACLARLGESALLVVTGPSGSGKSSLVLAGLVPALRAGGAEVEVFSPGADGALAMAAAPADEPATRCWSSTSSRRLSPWPTRRTPGRGWVSWPATRRSARRSCSSFAATTSPTWVRTPSWPGSRSAASSWSCRSPESGCGRRSRAPPRWPGSAWSRAWSTWSSATPTDSPGHSR